MVKFYLLIYLVDTSVNQSARTNPGPGAYFTPDKNNAYKNSPSWRIGTSTRDDLEKQKMRSSNFPPPDTYKPNFYPTKERMASFSFGSGKRSNFGGNSKTPAPGTYPITNRAVEGPRYNMGLKLDG